MSSSVLFSSLCGRKLNTLDAASSGATWILTYLTPGSLGRQLSLATMPQRKTCAHCFLCNENDFEADLNLIRFATID